MERQHVAWRIPNYSWGVHNFVDDVVQRQMLHATFVRSREAHGKILNIDTKAAREFEGVIEVYTAEDLGVYNQSRTVSRPSPHPLTVWNLIKGRKHRSLQVKLDM